MVGLVVVTEVVLCKVVCSQWKKHGGMPKHWCETVNNKKNVCAHTDLKVGYIINIRRYINILSIYAKFQKVVSSVEEARRTLSAKRFKNNKKNVCIHMCTH